MTPLADTPPETEENPPVVNARASLRLASIESKVEGLQAAQQAEAVFNALALGAIAGLLFRVLKEIGS